MSAKAPKLNSAANAASTGAAAPRRWWQWLLLYPSLALAILGAIPTFTEKWKAFKMDVPADRVRDAEIQNRLWQQNFECSRNAQFATIVNNKHVEIGSAVCESGDVLLVGKRPEWAQPQRRWISWDDIASSPADKNSHASFVFIGSAYAEAPAPMVVAQAPSAVLCQKWLGAGQLLQRVTIARSCYDQVINTYDGRVVSSRPAPCNKAC